MFHSDQDHEKKVLLLWKTPETLLPSESDFLRLETQIIQTLTDTPLLWAVEISSSSSFEPFLSLLTFLKALQEKERIDFGLISSSSYFSKKKLIAFDLDSTLLAIEGIDELGKKQGITEAISKITQAAMEGKIDFQESFRQRLSLLKEMSLSDMQEVASQAPLQTGCISLFETLKKNQLKTAIISGGFDLFAQRVTQFVPIDYCFTHSLEFEEGRITGGVSTPTNDIQVIDAQAKSKILKNLMDELGYLKEEVIAIGDGANDIEMLKTAGISVSFHGKPTLEQVSQVRIRNGDLSRISDLIF